MAVGVGLAGCGSDDKTAPSTPARETSEPGTVSDKAPEKTIAEYVAENKIVETPVRPGDPGSPTIELPVPPGWQEAGKRAPEGAYDAMVYSDPAAATDPPTMIVYVSKLAGNIDGAKILEYAPAEIQRLPEYQGPQVGSPTKLGGLDATQIGGAYTKNGAKRAVGQMTAVIPGKDGLYVLQLNAESPGKPEFVQALSAATAVIALQAKITP